MKKILILGIIGIIALSTVGCAVNSSTQNSKSNYESKSTSTEKATSADSSDNKSVTTGDASININSNATIDEKIALEEVNNINIEISAAKVSIKAYDGEEIKITGKLSEKSKGMIIDKKGTKFEIVEKEYNLTGSFINKDEPVGCGAIRPIDENIAELKRMFAKVKTKGVGTQILAYLEMQAKKLGYSAIWLETRLINEDAVSFYKKKGYSKIPNYGKYVGNTEAICFEKKLIN